MTAKRTARGNGGEAPSWLNDAHARRAINEQIKRRRAKRKRALQDFERAIHGAEHRARSENDQEND